MYTIIIDIMLKKMIWSVKSTLRWRNNNQSNLSADLVLETEVKDKIKSLIDFSVYTEDCESFMSIDKLSNKYDKKTKRLDLTDLVFSTMKWMFKDKFLDYISHPDFKKLIKKVYWLKWEFKINFNSEKENESFVLINITDSRRFSWFTGREVDWFIANKLDLKDREEINTFIRKVIYEIDESLEWYNWVWFKQFIYSQFFIEINKVLAEKNDLNKLFLNWDNWVIDRELFVNSMAWKIYRDNFDYVHKIAWHKLMSEIPKLVLDELLSNHSEDLKESINWNFEEIITFLLNYKSQKKDILEIENVLHNDVLINFQDKIKLYFKKFDDTEIDWDLLKWAISFLIENNNLSLNINKLSKVIFSLLDNNIDDLILLFSKFNWEIVVEWSNEYKYSKFQIRDFSNENWKNNVPNILLNIKLIKDELILLLWEIKEEEQLFEKSKASDYKYRGNIDSKEEQLVKINKKIDFLVTERKRIALEISDIEKQSIIKKILINKWKINELKKEYNSLYIELIKLTAKHEDLEVYILWINDRIYWLNNTQKDRQRKIADLKLIYWNKISMYKRIKEDFMMNILFWREQIK